MSIPTTFRMEIQRLGGDRPPILTRGADHLLLYPIETWEAMERELMSHSSLNDDAAEHNRLVVGGCWEVPMDAQGRILIPAEAREHAQLDTKVTLLGVLNTIEIWNTEVYQEREKRSFARFGEIRKSVDQIGKA